MKQEVHLAALLALAMFVQASSALAQHSAQPQEPTGPFRGLFGGIEAGPNNHQALNFTFAAFGGYDDNLLAESGIGLPSPRLQVGGTLTGFQAALDYVHLGRRLSLNASAGSGYRYYPDLTGLNGVTPWVSAGLYGALGRHTGFALDAGASYSPYYSFGLAPDLTVSQTQEQVVTGSADRALFRQPSYMYTARARLNRSMSPRSRLSADYALFRYSTYSGSVRPLTSQSIGASFARSRSRTLELQLDYTFNLGTYDALALDTRLVYTHDVQFGVYRTLAVSRRSSLGLSVGPSVVDAPSGVFYRAVAGASVNLGIGRTWDLQARYRRGVRFVPGFGRAFFLDSVFITTSGLVGSRVELYGSAEYSGGTLGLSVVSEGVNSYAGTVGARVALVRYLALTANYLYYHYQFDRGLVLPPGVSRGVDRKGVRAGVTMRLPLLR